MVWKKIIFVIFLEFKFQNKNAVQQILFCSYLQKNKSFIQFDPNLIKWAAHMHPLQKYKYKTGRRSSRKAGRSRVSVCDYDVEEAIVNVFEAPRSVPKPSEQRLV